MNPTRNSTLHRVVLAGLLLAGGSAAPALAAVNEDEWYDPTDWFDGNNIEYDDTYDTETYDNDTTVDAYDYDYDWGYWSPYYDGYTWTSWSTYDPWDYNSTSSDSNSTSDTWNDNDWKDSSSDLADTSPSGTWYNYSIWVPEQNDQETNPASTSNASDKPERLTGKIAGLKSMQLNRPSGARGTFTVAKVSLDNGQSTIVNLGRESQLEDANLKKGDEIKALGRRGEIAGSTVFVAQKLQVNGQDVDANPVITLQGDRATSASSGTRAQTGQQGSVAAKQRMDFDVEISGTVASIDEIKADQAPAKHTLIRLTLEDGTSRTVDLGPGGSPDQIGLKEGDTVTVRGHEDTVQGRDVIVAELMRIDGEKVSSVSNRG